MIKLTEAVLISFGKFENKTISFCDGFQVIYGLNETGKSTLQLFLRTMLYGIPNRRKILGTLRERDRAIPWDGKNARGILKLDFNGRKIEIYRVFGKTAAGDKIEVKDSVTGDEIRELCANNLGEKLFGLTENIFEKTLWIKQKAAFPYGRDEEIGKRLMNLSNTGDENVSAERTLKKLDEIKKSIRAKDKRSAPGALDILRKKREDKTEERYRFITARRQEEIVEKKMTAAKKRLAEIDAEIEICNKEEQKQIYLRQLDIKAKKWYQAMNIEKKIKSCNEDEKIASGQSITEEEIFEAEKLENQIQTIDQTSIKSYDIKEEIPVRNFGAGLWMTVIGAIAVVAAVVMKYSGLMVFLPMVVTIVLGVSAMASGCFIYKRDKQAATVKINHANELKKRAAKSADEINRLKNARDEILKRHNCTDVLKLRKDYEYCREIRMESEKLMCAYNTVTEGENLDELKRAADEIESCDANELLSRDISEELKKLRAEQIDIQHETGRLSNGAYVSNGMRGIADIDAEINAIDCDIIEQEKLYSAAETAENVFREVYERRRSDFTPVLNAKVNEYLGILTSGRYNDIRVSDEYRIHVAPGGAALFDSEYFSNGTHEQIYLALRLALGELMGSGSEPVFLDDALTAYDDDRAAAAMKLLGELGVKKQVVMFTCHKRDADCAEQLGNVVNRLEE